MKMLLLAGVVSVLFLLCFAGFAIGLLVRNKDINTCGCGRGHKHHRSPADCSAGKTGDACGLERCS